MAPKSRKTAIAAAAKKREAEEKFQEMSTQNNSMLSQLEEMKLQLRARDEEVARQKALLEEEKLREKVVNMAPVQNVAGIFDRTDSDIHSKESNDVAQNAGDSDVNVIDHNSNNNMLNESVLSSSSVMEKQHKSGTIEEIPDNIPQVDASDVVGHDLYCVNMNSNKSGIDQNMRIFDHELCEFKVNSWKKHSPKQVVDIINSKETDTHGEPIGGVKNNFHLYFTNFAKEIFKHIGDIFPYLISPEMLGHICADFFAKQDCRADLNGFFKQYMKAFPGCLFTEPTGVEMTPPPKNCTQLLFRKLDLKFVSRSRQLKAANAWPYISDLDRNYTKVDQAKLRLVKGAPAQFDYSPWKSEMEKRFDESRLELSQRKGKRAANLAIKPKKKRVRRNAEQVPSKS